MSTITSEDKLSSRSTSQLLIAFRIAALWLALASLATVGLFLKHRNISLDGDYNGWAGASCMIMARAFNQQGLWQTHLVPFQNNLPVGNDPDVYLHWPPLYPVVLSFFVRFFGDSASSGRLLELVILLASALFIFLIARQLYTTRVGILSAFFFLTMEITFTAGFAILQQPLSLLFALVAVYCFFSYLFPAESKAERSNLSLSLLALLGALATALAVFSAWDPIFVPFGLLATALYLRHRKASRLAGFYCLTAVITFIGVQLLYILSYPQLFANQFATIIYRAGLSFHGEHGVRLATIVDIVDFYLHFSLPTAFWHVLRNIERLFPSIVVVASLLFAAIWWQNGRRADRSATWVMGSLFLPIAAWFLAMNNYVGIHSFPLIMAAPFAAVAAGFLLDLLWTRYSILPADRPILWTLLLGVPFVAILPILCQNRDAGVQPRPEYANLSAIIHDGTPADAIVLTPAVSLVPVYYSQRHVIRGINSDAWLNWAIPEVRKQFPGAPLYFATNDTNYIHSGLTLLVQERQLGDSILYRVPPDKSSPQEK